MQSVLLAGAVALAACTPDVPGQPTFTDDVRSILVANCSRCHVDSRPAGESPGVPAFFRVDLWDSVSLSGMPVQPGGGYEACQTGEVLLCGAREMKDQIAARIDDAAAPMPPGGLLPEWQRETLRRWAAGDGELGTVSSPPDLTVLGPTADTEIDQTVDVTYTATDPDADAVVVAIGWTREGGTSGSFAGTFSPGTRTARVDTSRLATGVYHFAVTAWDGTGAITTVNVPAALTVGPRNVPPEVEVTQPNGGEGLVASSYPSGYPIRWTAADVEGDALTFTVQWLRAGSATDLCTNVSTNECLWPLDGLPAGADNRIRVIASDGVNSVADDSDGTFSIFGGDVSFAGDVMDIFAASCDGSACHDGTAPQRGLDLSSASAAYAGLYDKASKDCPTTKLVQPGQPSTSYLMWKLQGSGACFVGSAMPKGAPKLTADQLAIISAWISAGAPNN